jgi:hypothetical protein
MGISRKPLYREQILHFSAIWNVDVVAILSYGVILRREPQTSMVE